MLEALSRPLSELCSRLISRPIVNPDTPRDKRVCSIRKSHPAQAALTLPGVKLISEASAFMTMPIAATEVRIVVARIDQRRSLRGPGEEALTVLADLGSSNVLSSVADI